MIIKLPKFIGEDAMLEIRWILKHWKTWAIDSVDYQDGYGMTVVYLGCLVVAYHHEEPTP